MSVFNRYVSQRHLTVFTGELLVIFGPMTLVACASGPHDALPAAIWKGGVVTAPGRLYLHDNDLHALTAARTTREVVIRLLQAVGTALILIALLDLALPWLVVTDDTDTPVSARGADRCVTRVGCSIGGTRLDKLPQLCNVAGTAPVLRRGA